MTPSFTIRERPRRGCRRGLQPGSLLAWLSAALLALRSTVLLFCPLGILALCYPLIKLPRSRSNEVEADLVSPANCASTALRAPPPLQCSARESIGALYCSLLTLYQTACRGLLQLCPVFARAWFTERPLEQSRSEVSIVSVVQHRDHRPLLWLSYNEGI